MNPFQVIQLIAFAARAAPEVIKLIASLIQIFTDEETDQRVEEVSEKAVLKLNVYLRDARRFVRNVQELDFGEGPEGNKNARFFNVVHSLKERAKAVGDILGETDARTLAQNGVKLERAEGAVAIPEGAS